MPTNPKKHFSIIAVTLTAALSTILLYLTKLNLLYSYLLSINTITFLIYGYDKAQAKKIGNRVPEVVLHPLTRCSAEVVALSRQANLHHHTP